MKSDGGNDHLNFNSVFDQNTGLFLESSGLSGLNTQIGGAIKNILSVCLLNKVYTLDTQKYITTIQKIQGIDIHITQYVKNLKKNTVLTLYSDRGYDVYVSMLLGYYDAYGALPVLSFRCEEESHMQGHESKEYAIDAITDTRNLTYLLASEKWKKQSNGSSEDMFYVQNNTFVLQHPGCVGEGTGFQSISFEVELLPVYLQAYINIEKGEAQQRRYLRKMYTMVDFLLRHPEDARGDLALTMRKAT